MPAFDRMTATINWDYFGANYATSVHGQVIESANPEQELELFSISVLGLIANGIGDFVSDELKLKNIVARRLLPGISDVYVRTQSTAGSRSEPALPGTLAYLFRYYCSPYKRGSSYRWMIPGVTTLGNNGGLVTDELAALITDFVNAVTSNPVVNGGLTFNYTSPHTKDDVIGQQKPTIEKVQLDGTIRNLRSRQVYVQG